MPADAMRERRSLASRSGGSPTYAANEQVRKHVSSSDCDSLAISDSDFDEVDRRDDFDGVMEVKTAGSDCSQGAASSGSPSLNGRCCECLPISRELHYNESLEQLGLVDCLDFGGSRGNRVWFTITGVWRLLCQLMTVGSHWVFINVSLAALLANDRFHETLKRIAVLHARHRVDSTDGNAQPDGSDRKKLERQALADCGLALKSIFSKMHASMSLAVLRFVGMFFSWLLGRHVSNLYIPHGQLEMLKQATRGKVPVVFVPLHRSHLDYIVLHYALLRSGVTVPYVAAGDNLNIPVIGWFLRRLGAFFIRRKTGPNDALYRAALSCYLEELLKSNMSVEFFIEGGRSRSGRACVPRTGLLSVVVDTLLDKRVDDVLIVPVAIQYEVVFDRSLIREQLGLKKQRESIAHAFESARRLLRTRLGQIRIDLCQPIQLSEFARMHKQSSIEDLSASRQLLSRSSLSRNTSVDLASPASTCSMSPRASICSFSNSETQLALAELNRSLVDERRHALVQKLAQHIMYSAMQAQTLMASNLTAFLLLTEFRNGATTCELAAAFSALHDRLRYENRHCGFALQSSRDAVLEVKRSVELLNDSFTPLHRADAKNAKLISVEKSGKDEDTMLRPNFRLREAALSLAYYAAPVQSAFALQSVVVTAALSIAAEKGCFNLKFGGNTDANSNCLIELKQLHERSQQLAELLKNEFCFFAPCVSFETAFRRALVGCIRQRVLTIRSPQCSLAKKAHDSDEEEREDQSSLTYFAISMNNSSIRSHVHSIVPLVDAYLAVCEQCVLLGSAELDDSTLFDRIQSAAELKAKRFTETFSLDTLRRALQTFVMIGVLDKYSVASVTKYQLGERFTSTESQDAYLKTLRVLAFGN